LKPKTTPGPLGGHRLSRMGPFFQALRLRCGPRFPEWDVMDIGAGEAREKRLQEKIRKNSTGLIHSGGTSTGREIFKPRRPGSAFPHQHRGPMVDGVWGPHDKNGRPWAFGGGHCSKVRGPRPASGRGADSSGPKSRADNRARPGSEGGAGMESGGGGGPGGRPRGGHGRGGHMKTDHAPRDREGVQGSEPALNLAQCRKKNPSVFVRAVGGGAGFAQGGYQLGGFKGGGLARAGTAGGKKIRTGRRESDRVETRHGASGGGQGCGGGGGPRAGDLGPRPFHFRPFQARATAVIEQRTPGASSPAAPRGTAKKAWACQNGTEARDLVQPGLRGRPTGTVRVAAGFFLFSSSLENSWAGGGRGLGGASSQHGGGRRQRFRPVGKQVPRVSAGHQPLGEGRKGAHRTKGAVLRPKGRFKAEALSAAGFRKNGRVT